MSMLTYAFFALALALLPGLTQTGAQPPTSPAAPADAQQVRAQIQTVEELLPHLADRGAALFLLAKRYAHLGESEKALSLLDECIALNEGFDPDGVAAFQPLASFEKFHALVQKAHGRTPPVHHAHIAFTVADGELFPEGLAYDPNRHLFYMGSMHRKKIVQITASGAVSDFVTAEAYGWNPVGGVKVDPVDHSLWAATDPYHDHASELVHFSTKGTLIERYPAPGAGPHVLNDLVIRNAHEIYITDTRANEVYRFDRTQHSFTPLPFPRPLFGPNGITLSMDHSRVYIADDLGVIACRLRDDAYEAQDLTLPRTGATTLAGIDGLYWYQNSLLGVQYGAGSHRVVRYYLSPDGRHVTHATILESHTDLVSFPTTGAIAGTKFYFIANTGIGNLRNDEVIDPKKLEPIHIAVIPLTAASH